VIGKVAASGADCSGDTWACVTRKLEEFYVRSSTGGDIWLIVGTDSGFEGAMGQHLISQNLNFSAGDFLPRVGDYFSATG